MKKLVLFSTIALIACACAKTVIEDPAVEQEETCTVTAFVPQDSETKTHLDMSSAPYQVTWATGDRIFVGNEAKILAVEQGATSFTLTSAPGFKDGTFTQSTGAAVAEGDVVAIYPYCGDIGTWYVIDNSNDIPKLGIVVPSSQDYLADGVTDGYIPMIAHGDRNALHFKFLAGILQFGLKDDEKRTVSKITVVADQVCAGNMKSSMSALQANGYSLQRTRTDDATKVIEYNVGTTLDDTTPTYFNIVMFEGDYTNLKIMVSCTDKSTMMLNKAAQTITAGTVHKKGSYEYVEASASPISFTVDGAGDPINFNALAVTSVAAEHTLVFSSTRDAQLMTTAEVEAVAAWVKNNKTLVGIDLSGVSYSSTTMSTAFRYNDYIWSLSLPKNIVVTSNALRDCKGVRYVTLPSTVTTISGGFLLNDHVVSLTLPQNVATVENYSISSGCGAFYVDPLNTTFSVENEALIKNGTILVAYPNESATTAFVMPDEVESISGYAFYAAKNLTSITIGASSKLKTLSTASLSYMSKLSSITCNLPEGKIPTCASGFVFGSIKTGGTLTVPTGLADDYYTDGNWRQLVDSYGWTITDGSITIEPTKASLGSIYEE